MPKISPKITLLISGITFFLVIATLLVFYFTSQNSANNSKSQAQNSQNSLSNSNFFVSNSISNSLSDSISNTNSSQTSAFSGNSQNNSTIPVQNPNQTLPNNSSIIQTYTNPNYPNLGINYDNSWKIETTTKKSDFYENIMIRTVILTKNKSEMKFLISPIVPSGCAGGEETPSLAKLGNFNRFKTQEDPFNEKSEASSYYYSKNPYCNLENNIKSNINSQRRQANIRSR